MHVPSYPPTQRSVNYNYSNTWTQTWTCDLSAHSSSRYVVIELPTFVQVLGGRYYASTVIPQPPFDSRDEVYDAARRVGADCGYSASPSPWTTPADLLQFSACVVHLRNWRTNVASNSHLNCRAEIVSTRRMLQMNFKDVLGPIVWKILLWTCIERPKSASQLVETVPCSKTGDERHVFWTPFTTGLAFERPTKTCSKGRQQERKNVGSSKLFSFVPVPRENNR